MEKLPPLLPSDIILSRSKTFLSKAIRFFGKLKTGSAYYSHSALVLNDSELIESLWRVNKNPVSKYEGQDIAIWRCKFLTDEQRISIAKRAESVEGGLYGIGKIPLFALDSVFHTYLFTRMLGVSNFKVCSNLIAWSYYKELGHDDIFGPGWRSVAPDTIDDWCRDRPMFWQKVIQ